MGRDLEGDLVVDGIRRAATALAATARAHGVAVTNTPGAVTDATADIAMTLILMEIGRFGTLCSETLLALTPEQMYSSTRSLR